MALTALILEDQAMLEQHHAATQPRPGVPSMMESMSLADAVEVRRPWGTRQEAVEVRRPGGARQEAVEVRRPGGARQEAGGI